MPNLINVTSLSQASVKYNPELLQVAHMRLVDFAKEMKINVIIMHKDDVVSIIDRRGNIMRPYGTSKNLLANKEFLKATEQKLELKRGYINLSDDISAYSDNTASNKVLANGGFELDPKTGDIPKEALILTNVVKTLTEDIIYAIPFAKRDETDLSPLGVFDGFNQKIDDAITAGHISLAKGNLVNLGNAYGPADQGYSATNNAYLDIVTWLSAASPKIKRGYCVLRMTNSLKSKILACYKDKVKSFKDSTWEDVTAMIKSDTNIPQLEICVSQAWGIGDRITLTGEYEDPTMRDLFDFGINIDPEDSGIFKIRDIDENPNIIQYYAQPKMGCRIKGFNKNVFMVNEKSNTPDTTLSGDYTSAEIANGMHEDFDQANATIATLNQTVTTQQTTIAAMQPLVELLVNPNYQGVKGSVVSLATPAVGDLGEIYYVNNTGTPAETGIYECQEDAENPGTYVWVKL